MSQVPTEEIKQFSVKLPVELVERLDEYATRTERSRAGAIRFALERLLAVDRTERAHAAADDEHRRVVAARMGARRG